MSTAADTVRIVKAPAAAGGAQRLPYADEHEFEVEPGLPEPLPAGESVLWRGQPNWRGLALRAFHVRKVAFYFAVLIVWRMVDVAYDTQSLGLALGAALPIVLGAAAGLGILCALAWLSARATIYTVTDRRVVMRIGIALPLTINVPYTIVGSAWLASGRDGRGDLALTLNTTDRIGWIFLWPHARPWHVRHPQPMLRALDEPQRVASLLSTALLKVHAEGSVSAASAVTDSTATDSAAAPSSVPTLPMPIAA